MAGVCNMVGGILVAIAAVREVEDGQWTTTQRLDREVGVWKENGMKTPNQ